MNLFKQQRQHRAVSQGVQPSSENQLSAMQQASINLQQVNRDGQVQNSGKSNQGYYAQGNGAIKQNGTQQASQKPVIAQQSHSVTRDLDAMGLLTQVKKGDDARMQKKQGQTHTNPRQGQASGAAASGSSQHHVKQKASMNLTNAMQQHMYYLLKPQTEALRGRKTLILDVDETLVHSSFTPTDQADIVLPIDIEGRTCNIYVQVRPDCCEFIVEVGKYFEVVIFTASLSKYAIPLMDILDPQRVAPQRLFRDHCTFFNGQFVKDMQRVGRRMEDTIIIDNSPNCYQFQPENGLPIISWYDDMDDRELMRYVPALKLLAQVDDVRPVILQSTFENVFDVDLAIKICESLLIIKQQKEQAELEKQKQIALEREQARAQKSNRYSQNSSEREQDFNANLEDDNHAGEPPQTKTAVQHWVYNAPAPGDQQTEIEGTEFESRQPTNMNTVGRRADDESSTPQKTAGQRDMAKQTGSSTVQTSQGVSQWVQPEQVNPQSSKEVQFNGSGKKASQPKQSYRSSSKQKDNRADGAERDRPNRYAQPNRDIAYSQSNRESSDEAIKIGNGRKKDPNLRYVTNENSHVGVSHRSNEASLSQSQANKKKSASNSLNPDKLKQYLMSSHQEQFEGKSPLVEHSRNQNQIAVTNSQRAISGQQPLVSKKPHSRTQTADVEHRKNAGQHQGRGSSQKTSELRQSLKMGKRRANSNHVEKKMNLDKFLSVVQNSQRTNFTPSNQAYCSLNNKLVPGPSSIMKDDRKYQSNTLSQNQQQQKAQIKKVSTRQSGNATEQLYGQKKLNLKMEQNREANKTNQARGIQLNQNDIVFSKTMNLSQFLSQQTQGVKQGNATTKNRDIGQGSPNGVYKVRSREDSSRQVNNSHTSHQSQNSHKRQKSGVNSTTWATQNPPQLNQINTSKNPYLQNSSPMQQLVQTTSNKYNQAKVSGSASHLRASNNSMGGKRMSNNGSTQIPASNVRSVSNSQSKIKSKKQNSSTSITNTNERNNSHRVKQLDDSAYQFIGMGNPSGTQTHSLTRSNRDYQRSPGKIFNGMPNTNALLGPGQSQTVKNSNQKQVSYKPSAQPQMQQKRNQKPTLMSELTLSLKNKKVTPPGTNEISGYSNLIKPMVSAGRGPQSNKNSSQAVESQNARSYTQRVGAAQVANQFGFVSHGQIGRPNQNQIQQLSKNQISKIGEQDASNSNSKITPLKKVVKVVNNNTSHLAMQQTSQPNNSYKTHAALLNNYYQSLNNENSNEPDPVASEVPRGVQQHELKQRQQIYSMLSDFEKNSRFNKEQLKNFGSPKAVPASGQTPTTASGQNTIMQNLVQVGSSKGKQPKIKSQSSKEAQ